MSHLLGLDLIYEKLVLLEHFALGSREYCADRRLGSEQDEGDGGLDSYWSWVKGIVSSNLIECSVQARILQDSVREEDSEKLAIAEARATGGPPIGTVIKGTFQLTLRESWNKIIHATRVVPDWKEDKHQGLAFTYWAGDYRLSGAIRDEQWEVLIHVAAWAKAMTKFIDEANDAELTIYVGQDWY